MKSIKNIILTINGGSSSIKFAMYHNDEMLTPLFDGSISNINVDQTNFSYTIANSSENHIAALGLKDFNEATQYLLNWLALQIDFNNVIAIGHRLVHGMQHTNAEKISLELLHDLKKISSYDLAHLPAEIKLIEIFTTRFPSLLQIACFDTAFHTTMPTVAKLIPIPRLYFKKGIQRYGFHGISYTYLMQKLQLITDAETANGKIILAHLGSGASMAAVQYGKCIDTTMGFTPSSGLMMATRTGDIDPGLAWHFMQVEKLTPQKFNHLINYESGLLGISETTSDMKEIIKLKNTDTRAGEAYEMYCYQIKKYIGAYIAALEGVQIIVFSGGVGEHSPEVRNQICDGLEFLGIELDEVKNMKNELIISAKQSKVIVYVIKTNEQLMIAKMVSDMLNTQVLN
jgi:acetate kinase